MGFEFRAPRALDGFHLKKNLDPQSVDFNNANNLVNIRAKKRIRKRTSRPLLQPVKKLDKFRW